MLLFENNNMNNNIMKRNPNVGKKTDVDEYALINPNNYNTIIANTVNEITIKYVTLITEYMRFISEKIKVKRHEHFKFIIEKGIDTLSHIFSLIYYYTKNLDLTFYHCQKAYYFYIEFTEQISDEQINFLQLSSREAVLFVYKKTIYDLHKEYKKNEQLLISEEKTILATLDSFIKFNKIVTNSIIYSNLFQNNNKVEYIKLYCEKIMTLNMQILKCQLTLDYIDCVCILVSKFSHHMECNNFEPHIMFDVLTRFIKQLEPKKQKISVEQIKNKIQINEINDFFTNVNDFNIADFNNVIFNK